MVGPSGSGKTSLLMVLAGLERDRAAASSVGRPGTDRDSDEDALARLRRGQVGIVFQAFHLIPTMTALENVAVPLELAGAPDADAGARRASCAAVGLGAPADPSAGPAFRRRAAAGGAGPRLRAAAAPAAGRRADRQPRPRHRRGGDGPAVRAARPAGTTLLLITHDPALAARCDRHRCACADGRVAVRLAWRLALRELRGGVRGLRIVLACLALGVAAIAAVGSLRAGVDAGLAADGARHAGRRHRGARAAAQPLPDTLRGLAARAGRAHVGRRHACARCWSPPRARGCWWS